MTAEGKRLSRAVGKALRALADEGIPAERVLLAVSDPPGEGDTYYETHVGATDDRRMAALLSLLAGDLQREARHQGTALADGDACPKCGSPRWGTRQRRRDVTRIVVWRECMACGHRRYGP